MACCWVSVFYCFLSSVWNCVLVSNYVTCKLVWYFPGLSGKVSRSFQSTVILYILLRLYLSEISIKCPCVTGGLFTLYELECVPTLCELWELWSVQLLWHSLSVFMDCHPGHASFLFSNRLKKIPGQILNTFFCIAACFAVIGFENAHWLIFSKSELYFLNSAST